MKIKSLWGRHPWLSPSSCINDCLKFTAIWYKVRISVHLVLLFKSWVCCFTRYSSLCSWQGLGTMASTEAMRLFVKILEVWANWSFQLILCLLNLLEASYVFHSSEQEEDPGWYSRVSNFVAEPVLDVEVNVSFSEITRYFSSSVLIWVQMCKMKSK